MANIRTFGLLDVSTTFTIVDSFVTEYGFAAVPDPDTCPHTYGVIVTVKLLPLSGPTAGNTPRYGVVPLHRFTVGQPPFVELGRSRPGLLEA
jgi:hypothetical protein